MAVLSDESIAESVAHAMKNGQSAEQLIPSLVSTTARWRTAEKHDAFISYGENGDMLGLLAKQLIQANQMPHLFHPVE